MDKMAAFQTFQRMASAHNLVVIDVETTGLGRKPLEHLDEVVEVTVVDVQGNVLLNQLVKPIQSIPHTVVKIHGIDDRMVRNAPNWLDVEPLVRAALAGKIVTGWNVKFDFELMRQSGLAHNWRTHLNSHIEQVCAMDTYAALTALPGQDRAKFINLGKACTREGIDTSRFGALHFATGDCLRVLEFIKHIAAKDPAEYEW